VSDRFNIAARLRGTGGGRSLVFNSHLDTSVASNELLSTVRAAAPEYHQAWQDGNVLVGNGVCNDKGAMAAWLVAADAIRRAAGALAGDLVLTAVVGEIGQEPIAEFTGTRYVSKEIGTRYVIARGFVGDYALVAEGTKFGVGWVEAGKCFFRVRVFGAEPPVYFPMSNRPGSAQSSPNAIVRATHVIEALERWGTTYEQTHVFEHPGGTVVPKVGIGAVRGGLPYKITKTAQVCELYVDVRITPVQRPMAIERELRGVLDGAGVPYDLDLYTYRRGFAGEGVEGLVEAIQRAHSRIFGGTPAPCDPMYTSMWRDINPFNEAGIPAVMYGPGSSVGAGPFAIGVKDLVDAARAYALIALDICNTPAE
jgi:acetylornithine deacetylase/succinyl-diaminopimelate desuccinylase-like protein